MRQPSVAFARPGASYFDGCYEGSFRGNQQWTSLRKLRDIRGASFTPSNPKGNPPG